ncbi:MAG: glycosyltransferase [Clostridiales bacterium]|nr:glycosyltransferase [Clostridiales bacterium]
MEISLCMIVKDEEDKLSTCLDSVKDLVDEINIIDTGSTDKTIEIASRYTDRIFTFEWINDFSAARNFSFSKATKDYIFWLDADDVIAEEDRQKFKALKESLDPAVDIVFMTYKYYCIQASNLVFTHMRERILKRSANFTWEGAVHEHVKKDDERILGHVSDVVITHNRLDTKQSLQRNADIVKGVIESGKATFREKYYYAMNLKREGKPELSLKYFLEFLEDLEDGYFECVDGLISMHDIYMEKGEPDKALAILLDNESLCSDMSEFYCALGNHYKDVENNPHKAASSFERALLCEGYMRGIELHAFKKDAFYYSIPLKSLGQCQVKMNQFSEALTSYKRARIYNRKDMVLKELCDSLEKLVGQIGA